jgi:hypothetical protein
MTTTMKKLMVLVCAVLVTGVAGAVPRTFVSAMGSDGADCSRATPCRTFAHALTLTDASGEVIALTSGSYDPFTITKAVAITVPSGVHATVTSSGPSDARNGITVSAGASDVVVIRGLEIDTSAAVSAGAGASGISYQSADTLFVEDVTLVGNAVAYTKAGIIAEGTTAPRRLVVRNVVERGYLVGLAVGLFCCSLRPDSVEMFVEDSQFYDNGYAGALLEIKGTSEVVIRNSLFSGNGSGVNGSGIYILRGDLVHPGAKVTLEDNVFTHNSDFGIRIVGGDFGEPIVAMAHNLVAHNPTGVKVEECPSGGGACGGGTIAFRMGNNTVRENTSANSSGPVTLYSGL